MSPLLLPPLFVKALAAFLHVERVLFLSREGPGDLQLHSLADLSRDLGVTVQTAGDLTEAGEKTARDPGSSLVVDAGRFHREVEDDGPAWFRGDRFWLLASRRKGEEASPPASLRMDSNFLTASPPPGESGGTVVVREWYRIRGALHSRRLGTWSEATGLDVGVAHTWERRRDMHGVELRAATNFYSVFVTRGAGGGGGGGGGGGPRMGGLVPDIVRVLQDACNFTVKWVVREDQKYGVPAGNGTWNGLVGMGQRKEVDLVAAALSVTLLRSQVVSYAVPFIETRSTLIVRNPSHFGGERGEVNLTAFLSVFTPSAWLLLAVMLLVIMSVYFAALLLTAGDGNLPRSTHEIFLSSVAFGCRAFLQLDLPDGGSRHHYYKVLLLAVVSCAMTVVACYEGMLMSFMTLRIPTPRIKSFFDAVELGYRVVILDGSNQASDLRAAPDGSGRKLVYEELIDGNPDSYLPTVEAIAGAILEDPLTASIDNEYSQHGDGRLVALTGLDEVEHNPMALAFQKDSELLGIANYYIIKMHQSGTLSFLRHKWVDSRKPEVECGCNLGEGASALGYSNLMFPILILGCGGMLAPTMSLLEALLARRKKKLKQFK